MGLIQNIIQRAKAKKARFNDAQDEYEIQKKVSDRQLSANERELRSYMEDNRKRMIDRQLEFERKRRLREWWNGNQILKEKNIFANKPNIFVNQKRLFLEGRKR